MTQIGTLPDDCEELAPTVVPASTAKASMSGSYATPLMGEVSITTRTWGVGDEPLEAVASAARHDPKVLGDGVPHGLYGLFGGSDETEVIGTPC